MTDFDHQLHQVLSRSTLRTPHGARDKDRTADNDSGGLDRIPGGEASPRASSAQALVAHHPKRISLSSDKDSTYSRSSIKVIVGEQTLDRREFDVDETLIRSNSGYFNKGFERREFLNDEKPQTIRLPKMSARVFQVRFSDT